MALDPRIALLSQAPDIGPAIKTFENALMNAQIRELKEKEEGRTVKRFPLEQKARELENRLLSQDIEKGVIEIEEARARQRISSVANFSLGFKPVLERAVSSGNTQQAQEVLISRLATLKTRIERGEDVDTFETEEALKALQSGNIEGLLNDVNDAISIGQRVGAFGTGGASTRAFAPVVDPQTGKLGIPTFDPRTNQVGFQEVPGAPTQQTPLQKQESKIRTAARTSDIAVEETRAKETIKRTAARTSDIKKEISERNRGAARGERTLNQALTLAKQSSQGLSGAAKLQLSRLIPGIDAGDEAALEATLKQLSLEQLQLFKGPTTDFEFGVTESIAGTIGNSKEANISRIKSLKRANWFNQREFNQFDKHIKSGGDPDAFKFNFGEPIKTKKGVFTLQDIQDTAVQNNLTIEETIKRLNR